MAVSRDNPCRSPSVRYLLQLIDGKYRGLLLCDKLVE